MVTISPVFKKGSTYHVSIALFCVLCLVLAQTLSGAIGYLCQCSGQAVATPSSHCHGPHGENCHTPNALAEISHPEDHSTDREDHQSLNKEILSSPTLVRTALLPSPIWSPFLPVISGVHSRTNLHSLRNRLFDISPPPLGISVFRTVVLRV